MSLSFRNVRGFPKTDLLLVIFILIGINRVVSQPTLLPIHGMLAARLSAQMNDNKLYIHNAVQPYTVNQLRMTGFDSVCASLKLPLFPLEDERKIREESKGQVNIRPVFKIERGYEFPYYKNNILAEYTIGLSLNLSYKKRLAMHAFYLRSNASYPDYQEQYILTYHIIPSQGYAYDTNLGWRHNAWGGDISWNPSAHFCISSGVGKHFWGDGYRSLFLSDISYNYPYLKLRTNAWHLQYTNLYANFYDIRNSNGSFGTFTNKYASMHYLSWNITRRINLSLFEAIVWQAKDTLNNRGYEINYLNPVIFYRPVEYALGSSDNSLAGISARLKVCSSVQLYAQWLIDEFLLSEMKANNGWWGNKYGLQGGIKYFNMFGIRGLTAQAEINQVRPYTYSHGSILQNYGHFNQALAHPLGANFREAIWIMQFDKKRWSVVEKMVYSAFGSDTSGVNFGGDIYQNYSDRPGDYGHHTVQGRKRVLLQNDLMIQFILDAEMELAVYAGYTYRIQQSKSNYAQNYIYAGIRAGIPRPSFDY